MHCSEELPRFYVVMLPSAKLAPPLSNSDPCFTEQRASTAQLTSCATVHWAQQVKDSPNPTAV